MCVQKPHPCIRRGGGLLPHRSVTRGQTLWLPEATGGNCVSYSPPRNQGEDYGDFLRVSSADKHRAESRGPVSVLSRLPLKCEATCHTARKRSEMRTCARHPGCGIST